MCKPTCRYGKSQGAWRGADLEEQDKGLEAKEPEGIEGHLKPEQLLSPGCPAIRKQGALKIRLRMLHAEWQKK